MPSCHMLIACRGVAASPVVGRAVYAPILEVSFSLSADVAAIGKLGWHVRLLLPPLHKKMIDCLLAWTAQIAQWVPAPEKEPCKLTVCE